jgi:hypothetical protein
MSEPTQTETPISSLENELAALRAKSRLRTFQDLAREQGVKPMTNFDALLGVWPEEERDDGFEEAVLRWRREVMVGNE